MTKISGWVLAGVVGLVGCGSSTVDEGVADATGNQSNAVKAAAEENCSKYDACGEIGAGKDFTTREDCITKRTAFWNDRWPANSCDKRINGDQLSVCLDGLRTISCNSLIDELKVTNEKCPQSNICSGN